MNKQELIEKINSVLAEEFEKEVEEITPEGDIKAVLELDSLAIVDMIALIEQEFGVKIPTADLPKVKTFNALYDYIDAKLNA